MIMYWSKVWKHFNINSFILETKHVTTNIISSIMIQVFYNVLVFCMSAFNFNDSSCAARHARN